MKMETLLKNENSSFKNALGITFSLICYQKLIIIQQLRAMNGGYCQLTKSSVIEFKHWC